MWWEARAGAHTLHGCTPPARAPQTLHLDPNFVRLSKGVYSLHCFHPDKEVWIKEPAPKKRKADGAWAWARRCSCCLGRLLRCMDGW